MAVADRKGQEFHRAMGAFGRVKMERQRRGIQLDQDRDALAQIEREMRGARLHLAAENAHEEDHKKERASAARATMDGKAQIAALISASKGAARSTARALQRQERAYNTPTRRALRGFSSTAGMRRTPSPAKFIGEASTTMRSMSPIKPRALDRSFSPIRTAGSGLVSDAVS